MNAEQLPENNFLTLVENTRHPERQPILFERRYYKIQKTKRETKELGMETRPREAVVKGKFPNTRKPSHQRVCGTFGISEGNITWREKKKTKTKKTKKKQLTE